MLGTRRPAFAPGTGLSASVTIESRMANRRVLILTGAGASRNVGSGKPLPVMHEWALALRSEVDSRLGGLSDAIGLIDGLASEEFEEVVGALFSLTSSMTSVDRFVALGGPAPGLYQRSSQSMATEHARSPRHGLSKL